MTKILFVILFLLFLFPGCATLKDLMRPSDKEVSQQAAETRTSRPSAPGKQTPPASSPSPTARESVRNESSQVTSATNKVSGREQVRVVQERLKTAGFDPGPIDGILGARTKSALHKYQASRRLSNSGTLDDKTLKSLGVE